MSINETSDDYLAGYDAGQADAAESGYDDGYETGADDGRQEVYDELFNLGDAEAAWRVISANGRAWKHSNAQLVNAEWAAAKRDGLIK